MWSKLGGRKFIGLILIMGAAIAVDVYGKNGLSVELVGLFTALYTAYTVTNSSIKKKNMEREVEVKRTDALVDVPVAQATATLDQETVTALNQEFQNIGQGQAQNLQALGGIQKTLAALVALVKGV